MSLDHYPGTSTRLLELRLQVPIQSPSLGGYDYRGEIMRAMAQQQQAESALDRLRLIGVDPFHALHLLVVGAVGSSESIGYTLYYATNFAFTGLAVAVAFHAGLFNIGGEGQAYIGGLGCGLAVLALDRYLPAPLLIPLAMLAAAAFGAAWAAVPAWLQA